MDEAKRRVAIEGGGFSEDRSSSPSVMDWDGDKRDEVVILDRAGTVVVEHENSGPVVVRVAGNGDGIGTAPLADLNGDGVPDLVMGHVLTNVNGESVRGWPASRRLVGGFAPAIGDANGDGKLELFQPFYLNPGTVCGYDATGVPLAGWPQKVSGQCRFGPVLGDWTGTGCWRWWPFTGRTCRSGGGTGGRWRGRARWGSWPACSRRTWRRRRRRRRWRTWTGTGRGR
jgi:hypothetical protein